MRHAVRFVSGNLVTASPRVAISNQSNIGNGDLEGYSWCVMTGGKFRHFFMRVLRR